MPAQLVLGLAWDWPEAVAGIAERLPVLEVACRDSTVRYLWVAFTFDDDFNPADGLLSPSFRILNGPALVETYFLRRNTI